MNGPFFFHSPDNFISISDGTDQITMPLTDFVQMGVTEAAYTLPTPYISRAYIPTVSHTLHTSDTEIDGPLPYTNGDYFISRVSYYLTHWPIPVPPTLDEAKAAKLAEVDVNFFATLSGGIYYTAMTLTFPSFYYDANALVDYVHAGTVPGGFQILDFTNTYQSVNLTQLLAINTGAAALNYSSNVNKNYLYSLVAAAATVPDVNAIDATSGWPTVPYVI